MDAVVRSVRALLSSGYRLRDIAVLVRDLDKYFPPIGKSFGEHGIPYYFIDRRRKAGHHPLLHLLRSALEISRFEWKHDAVMSLLKTGLAGVSLDEADELENYVLQHRVYGAEWESPRAVGVGAKPSRDGRRREPTRRRTKRFSNESIALRPANRRRRRAARPSPAKRFPGQARHDRIGDFHDVRRA